MYICKVQGKCLSTIKNKKLKGYSLMVVQKLNSAKKPIGDLIVAVDTIGCSVNETVLVTIGNNSKFALEESNIPVDAVIVGIIDNCDLIKK